MVKNIIIIGGGPAGLMAAEVLAKAGHGVTIYDRKPSVGRKFLMAGRGGLNLTHSESLDKFLPRYNDAQTYLTPIIQKFSPDDLRAWCENLGQETFTGSSGRVFPKAMKASPLLRAWLGRLEQLGVQFKLQRTWRGWDKEAALVFETPDETYETVKPDAVLLALGGASWPGLGSDGSWQALLEASGVGISPLKASNSGFTVPWSAHMKEKHAGEPLKNITLTLGDKTVAGEIMISEHGVEGGAVYALSAAIREAIAAKGSATVTIDLRRQQTKDDLVAKLSRPRGRQSFSTYIQKSLSLQTIHTTLLREIAADVQNHTPEQLAALIKSVPLTLAAPFSIDRAISSAGGIRLDALDGNMMIKALPGVFAAGEMLDWEAPTGGYLLQACFATGFAAGNGMMAYLKSR